MPGHASRNARFPKEYQPNLQLCHRETDDTPDGGGCPILDNWLDKPLSPEWLSFPIRLLDVQEKWFMLKLWLPRLPHYIPMIPRLYALSVHCQTQWG